MLPHFILKLKLQMSVVQKGSGQLHAMGYITHRKKQLQVPTQYRLTKPCSLYMRCRRGKSKNLS
jgi:hypothetical protein